MGAGCQERRGAEVKSIANGQRFIQLFLHNEVSKDRFGEFPGGRTLGDSGRVASERAWELQDLSWAAPYASLPSDCS